MPSTELPAYGAEHRAAARRLKAAMRDGDPCCRCGQPMWRWQLALDRHDIRGIDADHYRQARAHGGHLPDALAHRRCNRSAGATLGNRLRGARRRGQRVGPPAQPARELPQW